MSKDDVLSLASPAGISMVLYAIGVIPKMPRKHHAHCLKIAKQRLKRKEEAIALEKLGTNSLEKPPGK